MAASVLGISEQASALQPAKAKAEVSLYEDFKIEYGMKVVNENLLLTVSHSNFHLVPFSTNKWQA